MKNVIRLILSIALPLLVGGVAGYATSSNISNWYVYLNKPSFNPPNEVFSPVWTALYILMGISLYLIWKAEPGKIRSTALTIFFLQLLLNFAWSFLFFYFHQTGLALIEIVLLWISIIFMIFWFHQISKVAAWLQLPYLLWVSFAACLNGAIWYMN
ncbi:TspO/MBR family protein [Desertivirga xinjiangensis]|uniref:TspO/MBR family protein n=1 Tax=Desertivirga xinjiangensis TaxID=539206 RepID=UPI00210AF7F4|nr:TspO/MBR family protein [Pedobacter xinjiangensis]